MRVRIKKEIKSMIQSMLKAHGYVEKLLQSNQIAEIKEILGQCQDCAIYIGKTIEESEGMGTQAVSRLELYCEQVYNISITRERKKSRYLKKQADAILNKVEQEVDNEITTERLKVVFLPYTASMWDCMETVWEAAVKDRECDAFVVPLPYYERNSKGNIEKSCYEGKEFPEYVPVIPYEKYSIEKEKPDIIYIHNPYDASNYVTSVYPEYYSSNLKKYTDMLVYIPYFISGHGAFPETHRALPAYLYMDKIIVQDDGKAKSLLNCVSEEKIAIIGSPKVDRLLKLNKHKKSIIDKEIPQIWKERIKNKKVILFNVSVSGILQNSEYALDKIRYVLSFFRNRKDVVLLWRPHPLIEATLKSMRLELYNEYVEIKKSFIKNEEGIFDESGDAGIASVIADAYLGECSSSLVHYFGVLGKPVCYMNWEIIEERQKEREFLSFTNYFIEGEELFFVPSNAALSRELYKFNLSEGTTEKIMTFPGTPGDKGQCYSGIKKLDEKIVLIPNYDEDIYVYDCVKRRAIKIVLSESRDCELLFNNAVEYNGKLFFIPQCYPAIVSLDMQTLEVCEFKECIKPFLRIESNEYIFISAFVKKEERLYLASCNDNRMLIFNMEDSNYEIKQIGNYLYGFGNMIYDGEYFWLTAYKKNSVVKWDEESGETKEVTFPIDVNQEKEGIWNLILDYKKELIICPAFSANIVFMDKDSGDYRFFNAKKKIMNGLTLEDINSWEGFMSAEFLDEETLLCIIWKNRSINLWNLRTNHWKSYPCRLSVDEMIKAEKRQIEKNWMAKSEPYSLSEDLIDIPQFIDYIAAGETKAFMKRYSCYQISEDGCPIGNKVHEYIKGKVLNTI